MEFLSKLDVLIWSAESYNPFSCFYLIIIYLQSSLIQINVIWTEKAH